MNFLTVIVFVACFAALRPSGTTPRRLEFLTEIVVVGMRHVPFERYDCPYENTGQTYFRVGCNMCECNRGDLVNCTKYRCSPDGSIAPAPEVECVDFEVKWDDCSVCFCRNETWRCVSKPCNKPKNKRSISGKNLDAFINENSTCPCRIFLLLRRHEKIRRVQRMRLQVGEMVVCREHLRRPQRSAPLYYNKFPRLPHCDTFFLQTFRSSRTN
jgi:hypothetical protein